MLVLTRAEQESIMIGEDIVITVLNIDSKYVRLGIKAPGHVAVDREEIYRKKQQEKASDLV